VFRVLRFSSEVRTKDFREREDPQARPSGRQRKKERERERERERESREREHLHSARRTPLEST